MTAAPVISVDGLTKNFGAAVKAYREAHPEDGLDTLRQMYKRWPFFSTLP